jgi:hypothetical protein
MEECKYAEIWLSMFEGQFRVSSRLPSHVKVPSDFLSLTPEGEKIPIYVSPLYPSIHDAKGRAATLQDTLQQQGCKVIFYFELRPPIIGNPHTPR